MAMELLDLRVLTLYRELKQLSTVILLYYLNPTTLNVRFVKLKSSESKFQTNKFLYFLCKRLLLVNSQSTSVENTNELGKLLFCCLNLRIAALHQENNHKNPASTDLRAGKIIFDELS